MVSLLAVFRLVTHLPEKGWRWAGGGMGMEDGGGGQGRGGGGMEGEGREEVVGEGGARISATTNNKY